MISNAPGPTLLGFDVIVVGTLLAAVAALAVMAAIYAAVTVKDPMAKRVKALGARREELKAGIVKANAYGHGLVPVALHLEAQGIARREGAAILSMPGNLMMDAARDGQGVAVIARAFVERDIQAGRLRLLMEDDERMGYFLVLRPGSLRPAQKAFATWVMRQAEAGEMRGI